MAKINGGIHMTFQFTNWVFQLIAFIVTWYTINIFVWISYNFMYREVHEEDSHLIRVLMYPFLLVFYSGALLFYCCAKGFAEMFGNTSMYVAELYYKTGFMKHNNFFDWAEYDRNKKIDVGYVISILVTYVGRKGRDHELAKKLFAHGILIDGGEDKDIHYSDMILNQIENNIIPYDDPEWIKLMNLAWGEAKKYMQDKIMTLGAIIVGIIMLSLNEFSLFDPLLDHWVANDMAMYCPTKGE
jgi:hypothetical protein